MSRGRGRGPALVAAEQGLVTCGDAGGRTKKDAPCAAFRNLDPASGRCMWHDESRLDDRARLCATRDRARAEKLAAPKRPETMPTFKPDTLSRLSHWHQWAVSAVATTEINTRTGDTICRHLQQLRPVLITLGLEERLKEAEQKLALAKKQLARKRRTGAGH